MSKFDNWIEYRQRKKERLRTKNRAEGLRAYMEYREAQNEPAPKRTKSARTSRAKRNQPDDWSFLDE